MQLDQRTRSIRSRRCADMLTGKNVAQQACKDEVAFEIARTTLSVRSFRVEPHKHVVLADFGYPPWESLSSEHPSWNVAQDRQGQKTVCGPFPGVSRCSQNSRPVETMFTWREHEVTLRFVLYIQYNNSRGSSTTTGVIIVVDSAPPTRNETVSMLRTRGHS